MTEQDPRITDIVDAAYKARRGITDTGAELTPQQVEEQRRKAEEAALSRLETKQERRAASKRYAHVRRALLNEVGLLKHSHTYDAEDRASIVDAVVKTLGGDVSKDVRDAVSQLVDKAADAIRSGDLATGLKAVDGTAETIANTPGRVEPKPEPTDDGDPFDVSAIARP